MKNLLYLLFTVVFHLIGKYSFAQTGPAGIGNTSNNIIWIDANELSMTDGSSISSAADISGNSNSFTQVSSTKRPVYKTNIVNGLPAIQFDGSNDVLNSGSIVALESANITYFIVFQKAPLTLQFLIGANYTSSDRKWINYTNPNNNNLISAHYSPTIKYASYNEPTGAFSFTSTHITPSSISTRQQGTLKGAAAGTYTVPSGHNKVTLGNVPYTTWQNCTLNGYIAEVIVFNTALTNLQRILVENYLGAKYNMSIPTDLYAFEASHNIGLIGIGNDGVNTQTDSKGYGILEISNPSAMSSGEYLLLAHTNTDLSLFTTADIPASEAGSKRWNRSWRADETGDVGNVTLTFYLSSGNNFATSSTYRLLVDNVTQNGDFSDASVITGTYNSGSQTMSFTTNIADGDYFTLCGVEQILEIHSITSGPWSNPNTWDCTCIPTSNDLVYIDPFNEVTVDIDAETDYLSVEPNGILTMSSAVTLSISGDWDIIGTLNFTNGKIALVGDVDQYVDAGGNAVAFYDVEINNSSSGSVTFYLSQYTLNGTLYPTNGNMVIDPTVGNEFIINSTSDVGGGRVAAIGGSATITGDFVVRRFIPAGVADYRDICSPVIGATLTQWDDDLLISGVGFPDGCAYGTGGCYYSVKRYVINQYVDQTSMSNPLTNGVGFEAYMGDDTITFSGTTLDVTGPIRDANDYVVTVGNLWQIQGNPYASPISFSTVTRSHVDNYFYVYDAATGFYEYWDGSDNSSSIPELANGIIAVGQGFWTYNWGTLTYKESDKVSTANYVKAGMTENPPFQLSLQENVSTYHSSVSLVEHWEATDDLDTVGDIRHLSTGLEKAPSVAFYSSEDDFIRKNYIKADRRNKSFDLYTKILNPGYYTINEQNIESITTYSRVLLYDQQTGEFIDLKKEPSYTFHSEPFEGHRFTLVLTNEAYSNDATIQTLTINGESSSTSDLMEITQMGHSFNIQVSENLTEDSKITVTNVLGQTVVYSGVQRLVEGSNMITVPADLKGVHILVITTGNSVVTKKVVL